MAETVSRRTNFGGLEGNAMCQSELSISWCVALSVLAITLLFPDTANAQKNFDAEKRVALVIGNSIGQSISRLNNPVNARLVAQASSAAVSPQTASLGRTGEVMSAADPSPLLSGAADTVHQGEGIYRASQQQQQNQQPSFQEVPQTNPTMPGVVPPATRPGISAARPGSRPIRLAALGGPGGTLTDAPPIGMGGSPAAPRMMPSPGPTGGLGGAPYGFGGVPVPIEAPPPRPRPGSSAPEENEPTVVDDIRPMSVRSQIARRRLGWSLVPRQPICRHR